MVKTASAVILPARGSNAIGTFRNLGLAGVKCFGVTFGGLTANSFSRYCHNVTMPDPTDHEEAFITALESFAATQPEAPVLFPMNDYLATLVVKYRARLQPLYRHSFIDWPVLTKCSNKAAMMETASAAHVPIPLTYNPDPNSNLADTIEQIRFPCIVKPLGQFDLSEEKNATNHFRFFHLFGKAVKLHNLPQLTHFLKKVWASGMRVQIQELVPGGPINLYTYAFVSDQTGNVLAEFIGRKVRQYPCDFGTVTVGESIWSDRVATLGARFLKRSGFYGIGNIEFKYDFRIKDFKLIEINPRTGAFISLPTLSGVNLSLAHYLNLTGSGLPLQKNQTNGVVWVDLIRDFMAIREQRKSDPAVPWTSLFSFRKTPHVHSYFSWSDPLPFFFLPLQYPRSSI